MCVSMIQYVVCFSLSYTQWAYFANTVVYSYKKPTSLQECVMFWNVEEQEIHIKTCQRLILMSSTTDYGLLVTESLTLENQVRILTCIGLYCNLFLVYIIIHLFIHCILLYCISLPFFSISSLSFSPFPFPPSLSLTHLLSSLCCYAILLVYQLTLNIFLLVSHTVIIAPISLQSCLFPNRAHIRFSFKDPHNSRHQ